MLKNKNKEPEIKILIFDIETTLLLAWLFSLGKQYMKHSQLLRGFFLRHYIICISYTWMHEDKVHTLHWGEGAGNSEDLIKKFDAIVAQADVTIGKNSDAFDVKHVNTQRLLEDLPPMPEWIEPTDDLQRQMKRYFGRGFPSQSLDYISQLLGEGGKNPVGFAHWEFINMLKFSETINFEFKKKLKINSLANFCTNVVTLLLFGEKYATIKTKGKHYFKEMIVYCEKDVLDTKKLWQRVEKHVKPRWNVGAMLGKRMACVDCGSSGIKPNTKRKTLTGVKQVYKCLDCQSYKTVANLSRATGAPGATGR